jgi:deoxyribodipyrimidine photolyase
LSTLTAQTTRSVGNGAPAALRAPPRIFASSTGVTLVQKYDGDGRYVRRWFSQLTNLPAAYPHATCSAPPYVLERTGVRLGRDYPHPLVDLQASRAAAHEADDQMRGRRT